MRSEYQLRRAFRGQALKFLTADPIRAQIFNQGCMPCESLELCLQSGPWACVATDGGAPGGQCSIAPASGG